MTPDYAAWLDDSLVRIRHLPEAGDVLAQVFNSSLLVRSGTWVEFGVADGGSLRRIVKEKGNANVWGFDTFTGLPEAWKRKDALAFPKGAFAQESIPIIEGAHLVTGRFEDTLQAWWPPAPLNFVHVDSDIYSAAACVFEQLEESFADGCIIVFDEAINYPGFEDNEMLALYEAKERGMRFDWLFAHGGAPHWPNERVAIRVKL
jgi:hypothetical protein